MVRRIAPSPGAVLKPDALVKPGSLDCSAGPAEVSHRSATGVVLRRPVWWLLCGLLWATTSGHAATLQYDGRATDPDSGRLLYTERHLLREVDGSPRDRLVSYLCPNGTLFARKRVDYAPSAVAPSFQLDDGRDGYREGVRRADGRISAFVRKRTGAPEESGPLPTGERLVADAGFDEYVRRNWAALVAGKTLLVDFAVPASRRAYTFKLRKLASPTIDGVPAYLFRLKISGLLGLVAPQIDVAYARQSKRLLRFEGVTNLRDAEGDQWTARIAFADRAATAVDDASWARAKAAPLGACVSQRQGQ